MLDSGGVILATAPGGYNFTLDSIDAVSSTIDTIFATKYAPPVPAGTNMCTVYGFIYSPENNPVKGVRVTASLRQLAAIDTTNGVVVGPEIAATKTDSTGKWTLTVIQSSALLPYQKYYFNASKRGHLYFPTDLKVVVPDSTTWQLTW